MSDDKIKPFEKLSKVFETKFESSEVTKEVKALEKSKNNIAKILDKDEWTLEDKEYMQEEIKTTIDGLDTVMVLLKNDIRIGSMPRSHEVYATLAKVKMEAIKELRELNQALVKVNIAKSKIDGNTGGNRLQVNNYNLNSADMLKMAKDAMKKSQMHNIKAEFIFDETEHDIIDAKMKTQQK